MQAEINGLMMAKKNSAVLWTVDQTGNVIGKEGRTTAQGNVGLGSDFVKSAKTDNAYVTHVSRNSDTGNLEVNTKQPELSELKGLTATHKNQSIITDDQGNIVHQALSDTQQTDQNTTTSFVSAVTQNGNGSVVVTTSDITSAAVGTSGIVPLIADITDVNHAIITNKEDHAVTPLGVKDAIDTLDVDDSAVTHKYVSSVSESNGKISVSREFLTLESINPEELHKGKTVGINATTGAIEPQDLSTVEVNEGNTPTNRFVSSIDQASNGQISYTTQQLKAAASNSIGGIKLGYTDSTVGTRNYAVNVDNSGKAYVNVPWTGTVTSISAGNGLTTDQTGGGAITGSGTLSVKADGTSITVGSSGIKVADPLPPHTSAQSGKYLGVKGDGTTDWLTVPQEEVFYAVYGTTTYQAVTAALTAGKLVYTKYTWGYNGDYYLPLTNAVGTTYYFETVSNTASDVKRLRITLTNADAWSQDEVITDGLPVHSSADASKVLVMNSYNTAEWRDGFVPIYTDDTSSDSVVGWKIATTKVPTSSNYDSSSVSAWVTIRSRGATSNPRNQGTLFAGYLWINYRGNGTSTPTMSTVFNSLTNYTRGWKLYRDQYTDSGRYVSDWYVCLPDAVQWIEITIHVLGTVGNITLCTDRVSEIGAGWNVAIEASKTPFMIGSGGVGGPNQPVYVNDDGKIVASSQIHTINIGGTGTALPSYVTADQYSEIQTAVNNNEDLAVWFNSTLSTLQYYYNGSTTSGYLFYRVGATEVSILQVDHAVSGQGRHDVTITTHQYDSSTQSEYLYSQAMLSNYNYSTIEAGSIASQGGGSPATVLLTESSDTGRTNKVRQLRLWSSQLVLNDYTDNTQNYLTSSQLSLSNTSNNTELTLGSSQLQITSGATSPVTINTTGFATSNGTNSIVMLNNGSGITVTDGNGTSTFTGGDGANHWGGYSISVGTLPPQGSNVIAFL